MDKRADVKVGFSCNNNCLFCVQAHKKALGNKSLQEIKKDLKAARKSCNSVVFTGGEATIRKDVFELVSFASSLGFETIQIQSNGRMFSYMPFCKKLIKVGANEFSPALHGHIAELHDYLTQNKGSFEQTVAGIKNLKKLGQRVITNSVVVKPNYHYLPELAKLLVSLKVDQFQMAFVHPIGAAYENYYSMVPLISLAAPYIHKALQIGIDAGIKVMAEAMPYCLMKGYEEYASENFIPYTEIRDIGDYVVDYKDTRVKEGKIKFKQCSECKYNGKCEGPWKEYSEKRGSSEFVPVKD